MSNTCSIPHILQVDTKLERMPYAVARWVDGGWEVRMWMLLPLHAFSIARPNNALVSLKDSAWRAHCAAYPGCGEVGTDIQLHDGQGPVGPASDPFQERVFFAAADGR